VVENRSASRQIFMSYAQGDETFVMQLAEDMSRSGAEVWLDIRDAKPGRHWARSIEHALSVSSMMVVVISPHALESPHIAAEWQAYLEAYRPVIPVLLQPCDPPGPLRARRPVDFTRERDYSRALHQLITRLIDSGTRTQRSDPVIWTVDENMIDNLIDSRERRAPAAPPMPKPEPFYPNALASGFSSGGLRRMIDGLRVMLRTAR
jgi:hypothetical protein